MKLVSIEPTPNPNSMKLNLDESLPKGAAITYRPEGKERYEEGIRKLLDIPGVQSVYHAADFMSVQRNPAAQWEDILRGIQSVFGGEGSPMQASGIRPKGERWGEVRIAIQQFRRIPMLVKVSDDQEELRLPLPDRFGKAVQKASPSSPNMLMERQWVSQIPRYGGAREIGEAVVAEVDAAYDPERLEGLVKRAFESEASTMEARPKPRPEDLEDPDWKHRYAALEAMGDDPAFLPHLLKAMQDSQVAVRRLATVLVGLVGTAECLGPLCAALKDPAVAVRRSAGDALSDLADPAALPAMAEALKDPNKLVRWRAARFLFELGDSQQLPILKEAENDPEFEVRMQVRQAIERIEGGASFVPVWQSMTGNAPSR